MNYSKNAANPSVFWLFTAFLRSINSLRKCLVRLSRSIASGTDFKPRANPGFSGRVAGHYESAPQAEAIALRRVRRAQAYPAASQNRRFNHSPTDALIDVKVGCRLGRQIPHGASEAGNGNTCAGAASAVTAALCGQFGASGVRCSSTSLAPRLSLVGSLCCFAQWYTRAAPSLRRRAGCVFAAWSALGPLRPGRYRWPGGRQHLPKRLALRHQRCPRAPTTQTRHRQRTRGNARVGSG